MRDLSLSSPAVGPAELRHFNVTRVIFTSPDARRLVSPNTAWVHCPSEEQSLRAMRQAEAGNKVSEICAAQSAG